MKPPAATLLRPALRAVVAAAALAAAGAAPALTFNYTYTPGTSAQAIAGFQTAGAIWSSLISDPVTVNLTVGTAALGSFVVGEAYSRQLTYEYTQVRSALVADATSANDFTAIANLPIGAVSMLINRTADNPNGNGSATAYLDNDGSLNNTFLTVNAANARALGLPLDPGGIGAFCSDCDAFIQFSTNFAFDYDRSNGITSGQIDFVGVALHEIGHALGFMSGVDVLDQNAPPRTAAFGEDQFTSVSPLDLFRYSAASFAQGVIDWTASNTPKYFSLNGGLTVGPGFALGVQHGDGRQASHWKDNLGLGLLDPTVTAGLVQNLGPNDTMAIDVVGWNLASVPEAPPALQWAAGIAALVLWCGLRRRRQDR